jgi:hypothetical protein
MFPIVYARRPFRQSCRDAKSESWALFRLGERVRRRPEQAHGKVGVYLSQEDSLMHLASPLVVLSFSAAICASAHAQTARPTAPASTYEEQTVGVRSLGGTSGELPTSGDRPSWICADGKWDAFRGPDHHPISEEAFYRIVGREDLLFRHQHKEGVKTAMAVSGGALILGGLLFAEIAHVEQRNTLYPDTYACPSFGCSPADHSGVSPVWGLAIAGAGLVDLIVGHYLNPTPINAGEADALARDYDQLLKSRLGISETAARE